MTSQYIIIDLIGKHCGMHYYHQSFKSLLKEKYDFIIFSNYGIDKQSFFPVIFKQSKFQSIILLIYSALKLFLYILLHQKNRYIYLAYGEPWDLPFLLIAAIFRKKIIIDIHEVHALRYKDSDSITQIYKEIYKNFIQVIIYHSDRTYKILSEIEYKGIMMFVPHFKYNFSKEYSPIHLGKDIVNVFQSTRRKFLFFGNISIVKGGNVLVNAMQKLHERIDEMEVVIAGKNVDNIDFSILKEKFPYINVIERHINDDELIYLYKHTDYVLLPYLKSSQSGIFEMSAFFNKPMILSEIPYFTMMLNKFPSFGISASIDKYNEGIVKALENNRKFYLERDINNYEMKAEFENFISDFSYVMTNL